MAPLPFCVFLLYSLSSTPAAALLFCGSLASGSDAGPYGTLFAAMLLLQQSFLDLVQPALFFLQSGIHHTCLRWGPLTVVNLRSNVQPCAWFSRVLFCRLSTTWFVHEVSLYGWEQNVEWYPLCSGSWCCSEPELIVLGVANSCTYKFTYLYSVLRTVARFGMHLLHQKHPPSTKKIFIALGRKLPVHKAYKIHNKSF